jgi:ABC-type nickel/cobalt efflux system permease component RcnA
VSRVASAWLLSAAVLVASAERPEERAAPPVRAVEPGPAALAAPAWLTPWLAELTRMQRDLNRTLSRNLRLVAREGISPAAGTVLLVAFAYGVLHAAGPGHGKAVVASYFLGRQARPWAGVRASFLLSLLQVVSSVALVAVLALIFASTGLDVTRRAVWLELVSYGLIVGLGAWMTTRAFHGAHAHGPGHTEERPEATRPGALVLAAGLTPCPSAIVLLLFALANGVFPFGIGASLVMAVGMGLTVSAVGVAAILARVAILRPAPQASRLGQKMRAALALIGGLGLIVVGGLFFASALARLPWAP